MSHEIVKKQGYMYKLPVKGLMKKWIKRWFVLYNTSHEGVVRVEYYDNTECATTGVGKRTIPLRDCSNISSTVGNKIHPYVFQFRTQLGHHMLAAESQPELESWMDTIKEVVHDDKIKRRRNKGQSRVITSSDSELPDTLDASGLSYRNKVDSGTYRVTVEENETSTKMNLSGTYSLELYPSKLILVASSGTTIFTIPYKFLKNYGKQSGQFHFEMGKNSPIGEGELIFVTTCSKEIFGVVHNNIKRLKEEPHQKNPTQQAAVRPAEPKVKAKPPPPKTSHGRTSIGSRPDSRHSTEIHDESIPGTYRSSKNMEELHSAQPSTVQETKVDFSETDPAALYSKVDMSKKSSMKKKSTSTPPVPYNQSAVPTHRNSARDSRMSTLLIEIEENTFNDSFDEGDDDNEDHVHEDESNLEPLTEGVSNPLDDTSFGGTEGGVAETTENLLGNLDFGFGPGNLGPAANVSTTTADSTDSTNMPNLMFDFGEMPAGLDLGPERNNPANDPFNMALVSQPPPAGNMAEFDFGSLDANFFEKLEAMEVKDKQVPLDAGPGATVLSKDELDSFWNSMNTSVQ